MARCGLGPPAKTISHSVPIFKDPQSPLFLLPEDTKCISHTNVTPQFEANGFNSHTSSSHRSFSRVNASNTLPHPLRNLPASSLTGGLLNCRSAMANSANIATLIMDEDLDFLCLTETWLQDFKAPILDELVPPHYKIFQCNRPTGRGGGVAVIFKKHFLVSVSENFNTIYKSFENLVFSFQVASKLTYGFALIYRPPALKLDFVFEFLSLASQMSIVFKGSCILGDLNFWAEDLSHSPTQSLIQELLLLGYRQHVTAATHTAGHVLDWLLFSGLSATCALPRELTWSDHRFISFSLALPEGKPPHIPDRSGPKVFSRNFSKVCPDRFGNLVATGINQPNFFELGDPVEKLSIFQESVEVALDVLAPRRMRSNPRPLGKSPQWFTEELRLLKKRVRSRERRWRKFLLEADKKLHLVVLYLYKRAIREAKKIYFRERIRKAANSTAKLFKISSELTHPEATSSAPKESQDWCQELADFFVSKVKTIRDNIPRLETVQEDIGHTVLAPGLPGFQPVTVIQVVEVIASLKPSSSPLDVCPAGLVKKSAALLAPFIGETINCCFRTGTVPGALKRAVVLALLKKPTLDPDILGNYRPISILPFVAKVMERLVVIQLQAYLESFHLLDEFQSGFRPGHGTETSLICVYDDVLHSLDRGDSVALVLLDLSAAFDTINHGILLERMRSVLGMSGSALAWVASFLEGRVQGVKTGPFYSKYTALDCGVPQGSALSPLLFNIYMRPLADLLKSHAVHYHVYADDTQVYLKIPRNQTADATLASCLEAINTWMSANFLKLNGGKTEVIIFSDLATPPDIPPWPPSFGPAPEVAPQVRDLGFVLDSGLTLAPQVKRVVSACHWQLKLLRGLFKYLDISDRKTVICATIGSCLDYCNSLYLGLPKMLVQKLQLIQNAAARLLMDVPLRDHITPVLCALHWLPVHYRTLFKAGCIMFKIMRGLAPSYLCSRFHKQAFVRSLRSTGRDLLHISVPKKIRRGGRAFSHQGAVLWNSLPVELQEAPTIPVFRGLLKTWLFTQAFPA